MPNETDFRPRNSASDRLATCGQRQIENYIQNPTSRPACELPIQAVRPTAATQRVVGASFSSSGRRTNLSKAGKLLPYGLSIIHPTPHASGFLQKLSLLSKMIVTFEILRAPILGPYSAGRGSNQPLLPREYKGVVPKLPPPSYPTL